MSKFFGIKYLYQFVGTLATLNTPSSDVWLALRCMASFMLNQTCMPTNWYVYILPIFFPFRKESKWYVHFSSLLIIGQSRMAGLRQDREEDGPECSGGEISRIFPGKNPVPRKWHSRMQTSSCHSKNQKALWLIFQKYIYFFIFFGLLDLA